MIIRVYKSLDLTEVADIYNQSRRPVDCFVAEDVVAEEFTALATGEEIQVVEDDGRLVGFISVFKSERFIHHLYVLPDQQKKGFASALIAACVARYGLPLSLKSLVKNTGACRFYERNHWIALKTESSADGSYHHYWLRDV